MYQVNTYDNHNSRAVFYSADQLVNIRKRRVMYSMSPELPAKYVEYGAQDAAR
jgi:hypothetical protein